MRTSMIALTLILLSVPAQAQERSTFYKVLEGYFIGASMMDMVSTVSGTAERYNYPVADTLENGTIFRPQRRGYWDEGNPLARPFIDKPLVLIALNGVWTASAVYGLRALHRKYPRTATGILLGLDLVYTWIVGRNIYANFKMDVW